MNGDDAVNNRIKDLLQSAERVLATQGVTAIVVERDASRPLVECQTPQELVAAMERAMKQGWTVWVKWTCPACGERCLADDANVFAAGGYRHTEKQDGTPCGGLYFGPTYGYAAAILPNATAEAMDQARRILEQRGRN